MAESTVEYEHWQLYNQTPLTFPLEAEERMWVLIGGWLAAYWRQILAVTLALLVLWVGSASPIPHKGIGGSLPRLEVETDTGARSMEPAVQGILAALSTQTVAAQRVAEPRTVMAYIEVPSPAISSAAITRPWQPADECAKIRNPGPVYLTSATMGWCSKVAYYLDLGERRGHWRWQPGDLTRLLLIIECESNGEANPGGSNPLGSLFQHDGRYFDERGAYAAAVLGFSNPTRHWRYPFDSIAVGVALYKPGGGGFKHGPGHWLSCSGFSASTETGRAVQATLRNMGLPIPTQRWN